MNGGRDIYLDYAAATPVDPLVAEAMRPYLDDCFYNPSAPYAHGRQARDALEGARASLAREIGAKPGCITLTAGATEACNLAFAATEGHVVSCAVEHESTLECAKARGASIVGVDGRGIVDPAEVERAIRPDTELVSISLANGEIGAVQPLRAIAKTVRRERERRLEAGEKRPIWLHTDATQAAGAMAVNVASLGADMMTLSAAKIYGPKQVGLLWAADTVTLRPLVLGGGQEKGVRSGTENVAGAVGFAKALELACERREEESARLARLRGNLESALLAAFPWAVVSGPRKPQQRLPGLLHISFPGLEARRLVIGLDRRGVSVGTGSACAASKMRVSHVLEAIGASPEVAEGSLRITLGRPTTDDDVERAAQAIVETVRGECARLRIHGEG